MNGRTMLTKARKGIAIASALRSGSAIAMFFGAISPITICRKTTMERATMNETE
jgi:hypothetical protein